MADRLPLALRLYRLASLAGSPIAPQLLARRLSRGKEHPKRLRRAPRRAELAATRTARWFGCTAPASAKCSPRCRSIERLRAQDFAVLVTSGTVTSAALADQRLPKGVLHQFIPLDAPRFVRRFLDHWRPGLALFVESDLWPNLILSCAQAQNSDDPDQRPAVGALVSAAGGWCRARSAPCWPLRSVPDPIGRRCRALYAAWRAARRRPPAISSSTCRRRRPIRRRWSGSRKSSARGRWSPRPRRIRAKRPRSLPRIGACAPNFRRC